MISDEAEEAAAKVFYQDGWEGPPFWESLDADAPSRLEYLATARAALEAAAPHMFAGVRGLHVQRSGDYADRDGIVWSGEHCGHCREEWPCGTIEALPTPA